jgi:hypothetical protein
MKHITDTKWVSYGEIVYYRRLNSNELIVKGSPESGYSAWINDEHLEDQFQSPGEAMFAAEWSAE